jgi:hypothetical protein
MGLFGTLSRKRFANGAVQRMRRGYAVGSLCVVSAFAFTFVCVLYCVVLCPVVLCRVVLYCQAIATSFLTNLQTEALNACVSDLHRLGTVLKGDRYIYLLLVCTTTLSVASVTFVHFRGEAAEAIGSQDTESASTPPGVWWEHKALKSWKVK